MRSLQRIGIDMPPRPRFLNDLWNSTAFLEISWRIPFVEAEAF
jgi:hypothetical protein